MTFDPFADDEAQTDTQTTEPSPHTPTQAPHEPPTAPDGAHKVRVTLKGGSDYGAPWITVDGTNVADAADQLSDGPAVDKLVKLTSNVARHFHTTYESGRASSGGGQTRQAGKPEQADRAPDGEERFCKHGQRKYMSGLAKSSGKPYKGFFCTSPDRAEQCKPEFVK